MAIPGQAMAVPVTRARVNDVTSISFHGPDKA
jgi:hypothetical protein